MFLVIRAALIASLVTAVASSEQHVYDYTSFGSSVVCEVAIRT